MYLCQKHNIPVYEVDNINEDHSYGILDSLSLDLIIVIGWCQLLSPRILKIPKVGVVGAHASLLPHNKGSAPVNWALIRDEKLTGNTLMWLDEGVDSGKIIDQYPIPIRDYDTCKTLYDGVAWSNYQMLRKLIFLLERGEKPGLTQPPSFEDILPRRRPEDGLIHWLWDSRKVYDFVRALTKPYPGAFSFFDGKKWYLWNCSLLPIDTPGNPGCIIGSVVSPIESSCGLMVGCGKGAVILLEIENEEGEVLKGYELSGLNWKGKVLSSGQEYSCNSSTPG
jgi:methionyl-tRNA formyltransferase